MRRTPRVFYGAGQFPFIDGLIVFRYPSRHASNRTARNNTTATLAWNHHHEQFDYDGLHRVEEARRGEDDGQDFTFSAAYRSQKWTLDALGNWSAFATGFDNQYDDIEQRGRDGASASSPAFVHVVRLILPRRDARANQ